ncbi:type II CAAX endopeptidase family protein [Chryseobacterium sp. Chry.R1]|uniref:CPBP family intramembrane glutamic endopeptidase n=1 Tax=Chryseobacterium sp. Chry.R1 TaxID=3139392 RepID=UPI0031F9CB77
MNIWKAFWITLVFCGISSIIYSVLILPKYFITFSKDFYEYYWIFINILSQVISFLIVKKLYFQVYNLKLNFRKNEKSILLPLSILVLSCLIIEEPFVDLYDLIFRPDIKENNFVYHIPIFYYILRLIKGCIIAPIVEELFFREFILKELNTKYSATYSIIISSILFSLFHMNMADIIPALIMGVFLGYIFLKSRKIEYTIVFHSILNFVAYSTNYYLPDITTMIFKHRFSFNYWVIIFLGVIISYYGFFLFNKKIKFMKERDFGGE